MNGRAAWIIFNDFKNKGKQRMERKERKKWEEQRFFSFSHKVDKHSSTTYLCIDHNGLLGVGGGKY